MNSTAPVFSIIIATHNRPSLLERAIQSVRAQTYPHSQLIVISDVHDEASYTVATQSMRPADIFIERSGSPGPSESRNLGLSSVKGDYFIFLDDDDSFDTDFLANCAAQLKERAPDHKPEQFFYTNLEVINEQQEGAVIVTHETSKIDITALDPTSVYVKNFVPNNCVIYPKKLALQIQFDSAIPYEDWDFILNAYDRMPLQHLPIYGPKVHKNNSTTVEQRGKSNEPSLLQCYLSVYGKHPAPSSQIATMRHNLFSSLGLDLDALLRSGTS
jgi:glycosyltransferase involved in cell wall biosynthesis